MSSAAPDTIGILGLGRIGRAVAANLIADGFDVRAVARDSARDFPATGGTLVPSAATLAATCGVVVSCLATEDQMRAAYLDADGLVAGARHGLVVIEMGTFPIALKRLLASAVAERGGTMLDCPISGTPPVVLKREAKLFVSGDAAAAGRCAAIFDSIAPRHIHVGAFGNGMAMKLVTNFLVILNTLTLAEAFVLGTRSGLDAGLMVEAIGDSFAGSRVFDFRAPMMAARTYQPAPGPAAIVWKDLGYIQEQGAALGLAAPLLETALHWYGRMIDAGRGQDECAGVFEELLAAARRGEPA
jgi:3-hydroxyisobutyrate dehydrogenase